MRLIGGWAQNRDTGEDGITLAGLLMFGKLRSILDAVPNYVLDYQERPEEHFDGRWSDRVTTDGSWSGNLFDFFRLVMKKLTADLKIPFKLANARRIDDTPVHEALREAFINTLIHADYTGPVPILVVKTPGLFAFRNPGMMRVPLRDALRGGMSDCRNRGLQNMFQLAGFGERAGSGIPKIWHNWQEQHWRSPRLTDEVGPEQTRLILQMVSLFPQEALDELGTRFGDRLHGFSDIQRLALATVCIEGAVTHGRLKSMSTSHSRDITLALANLVRDGLLESAGQAKGTYYFFPGESPEEPAVDITAFDTMPESPVTSPGSVPLGTSPVPLDDTSSVPLGTSSVPLDDTSSVPLDDTSSVPLGTSSVPLPKEILRLAEETRLMKKISKTEMRLRIHQICSSDYMTLKRLAQLLGRKPEYLRIKHLTDMVSAGELIERYPNTPTHPYQAYKSSVNASG